MNRLDKMRRRVSDGNVCDTCAHGEWDMTFGNLDIYGKPILLKCPNENYKIIRGTQACEKYQPKKTEQQ